MNKTIETHWEIWNYNVWGNRQEGYWANDRFCMSRDYPIKCKVKSFNDNTPHQFYAASISDWKIKQIFGVSCELDIIGDDLFYYVNEVS